jgi:RNA polymerase sigma-70 factor (ECF subfamily)
MRRVEDVPQKVIAQRLGITEGTVEKHLVRGIRMLADALFGAEQGRERVAEDDASESEPRHGD